MDRKPTIGLTECRVLLVEDHRGLRYAIGRTLEDNGIAVTEADDGAEALRLVEERGCACFDVIVCDYMMPGLTGGETINAIRRRCPDIRVIFVSGFEYLPPDIAEHEEFMPKPIDPGELARRIKSKGGPRE